MTNQEAYCKYLHEWADSHEGIGFEGCTPASYDEWACHEKAEAAGTLTSTWLLLIDYLEQDRRTHDMVALALPDAVTKDELREALESLIKIYGDDAYKGEDMLELTDEMLDELVSRWGGSWNYIDNIGVLEVNGHVRTLCSG